MKVLLTGATGFIGSKIVEELLAEGAEIYSLERITSRPTGVFQNSVTHLYHDFQAPLPERILKKLDNIDYIIHCGAEVHGLRSLENPSGFVSANVLGTFNLLEAARILKPKKFLYISTAEVTGCCWFDSFDEQCALRPSNPYAAAKASGEMLCKSYTASFGVPVIIARSMNVFGERQDTSKFIPSVIKKILSGERVPVHVGRDDKSGSRHWLHVSAFVEGLLYLLDKGVIGETYHIVGPEVSNQEVVTLLAQYLGRNLHTNLFVPGRSHDMRYSITDNKIPSGVYKNSKKYFLESLKETALAYQENQGWLV